MKINVEICVIESRKTPETINEILIFELVNKVDKPLAILVRNIKKT
jgi:hypothetical protein